jgi:predicted NUDIX family phosphoesterase
MSLPDRRAVAESGAASPPSGEQVLVVGRAELEQAGLLRHGFTACGWERLLALVAEKGEFVARGPAEEDPTRKQVIPYGVVVHGDEVFLFRRTARGAEARLHGKTSIGVGGHINPEGVPPAGLVEAGLRRELEEELAFDGPYGYRPVGLLNDDTQPVGRVHMGIVYLVTASSRGVRVREEDLLEGGFAPAGSLGALRESMETWSRLVAEALFSSGNAKPPVGGGSPCKEVRGP